MRDRLRQPQRRTHLTALHPEPHGQRTNAQPFVAMSGPDPFVGLHPGQSHSPQVGNAAGKVRVRGPGGAYSDERDTPKAGPDQTDVPAGSRILLLDMEVLLCEAPAQPGNADTEMVEVIETILSSTRPSTEEPWIASAYTLDRTVPPKDQGAFR